MLVIVRWHSQSVVSHSEMIESLPPVARYLATGDSSTLRHDEVCPARANSLDVAPGIS